MPVTARSGSGIAVGDGIQMKKKPALLLVVVSVAAAGSYFFFSAKPDGTAKGRPSAPVTVALTELRDMPVSLDLVGRAEAIESVTLKARVDGQVADVPFHEGQHVKKGDVLVRLDPADFAARLRQAEAGLARDQAQLAKAKADVERYVSLRQKGFISEEKLNEIRTNLAGQDAAVNSSQAALELARNQLEYATLRAPFAGIVGARLVFPGAAVKVNDTALAVVNRIKPLNVSFAVAEKYLPRLQQAIKGGVMKVDLTVPGSDRHYEGRVNFLDNAVDTATGTIRMKAQVANEDESLATGQFLNVSLVLETRANAVTAPAEAVQQGPEGNYVFVVKADGTAEMRKVAVIANRNGIAAFERGLEAGETVVTDGQLRLTPGILVTVRAPGNEGKGSKGSKAAKNAATGDEKPAVESKPASPPAPADKAESPEKSAAPAR